MPTAILTLRSEPFYRRDAFVSGLKRLGYTVELADERTASRDKTLPRPESRDDLRVNWNRKQGAHELAALEWERLGGTVITTENAYLQKVDKSAYAISVGGHCGSGWFPVDQAEDRFTPLGFEQQPWRVTGSDVLVCGQRGVGDSTMASPQAWGQKAVVQIEHAFRERGGLTRQVRLRPHPGVVKPRVSLEDDLRSAWACAIWSSACGVRALTMGVPVFRDAPHWICGDVSFPLRALTKYFNAPFPTYYEVRASLNKMSHGQWSVDEIAAGEPFARMKSQKWGRV